MPWHVMIRGPRSTIFDFPEINNIGFCTTGMAVLNCAGVECAAWPALLVFPGAVLLQCSVLGLRGSALRWGRVCCMARIASFSRRFVVTVQRPLYVRVGEFGAPAPENK